MGTDKVKKPAKVKLDLVHQHQDYVKIAQKECRAVQYDISKIMTRLNCSRQQAVTVASLASISDAQEGGKSAKP